MSAPPARIAFEVHPQVIGGTERLLCALLGRLDRDRFEPLVVAAEPGPALSLFEPHTVATAAGDDLVDLLRRLEIRLAQSTYFSPALALAAARAGIPHVWRIGGHVDVVQARQPASERTLFLGLVACLSRTIVCASEFLASQFAGVDSAPVRVIHNGVDLEEFRPRVRRAGPPLTVAMVAHLTPQKRHADFLRAAALVARAVPGARFSVFGARYPGAESADYVAGLERLVAELGVGDRLTFRHLTEARSAALAAVDVFVLPSVDEGASNAVLEAMALGRPVIAARSGGNTELVEDGVTGLLVPPEDPGALAEAIRTLLEDPDTADRFGAAARRRCEERFDMSRCARAYESTYEDVLRSSS